jgi:excisionase family DNA binding protein
MIGWPERKTQLAAGRVLQGLSACLAASDLRGAVGLGEEEGTMPDNQDDRMLSLKECADWLGVSMSTMRTLVKKEEIVAKKIGGLWRVRPQDLESKWKD